MANEEAFKLQPAPGRIAIKLIGRAEKSSGGIIIPDVATPGRETTGEVIAVCAEYEYDGKDYVALYNVGDIVLFGKYSGTEISWGRNKVLIINEKDILATLIPAAEGEEAAPREHIRVADRD